MKPNKEITSGVALLFLIQNLFLPSGVQAQTAGGVLANVAGGVAQQLPGIFGQNPASPNFNSTTSSLQSQMNSCAVTGALGLQGDLNANAKSAARTADEWKTILGGGSKGGASAIAGACASCKKPDPALYPEDPNCNKFADQFTKSETSTGKKPKSNYQTTQQNVLKEIGTYMSCLEKNKGCKDPKQAELEKQLAVFNCQMKALEKGVQESAKILNESLAANQKTFGQMNQYQKEIGEQMQQVDEILGPDPELGKSGSSQMQGLLGLQKELNESLPKMVEAETKFKTEFESIKNNITTNEQNLEATRVNVASQCIKGSRNVGVSGGYSLTCFKPVTSVSKDGSPSNVTDRNGNVKYAKQSCGPYDYIRSKIEQRAFVTSRGVMMSESRREKAAANSVAFDSLVDSINRVMGDYDSKGADGARLDTDIKNWGDIESKVSANIDAVSGSSGVDVRSMLRAVAGHCFQEADGWKNKQIRSSGSEYSKKKAELKASQTNLAAQMETGLTSMNKTYGDVMAVMFNKHVTLNRTQCTKDNPELMQKCFGDVRQNVQNLLEGNGGLTTTAKTIKAGPMTPGFVVSCRGLNGCVTAFKNVRDGQKTYIRTIQKTRDQKVTEGNDLTKKQLSTLGNELSTMQNSLMAQYDKIKASLTSMGIDAPEKPKTMEAEMLNPMEGPPPDKAMGPFQNPKNMTSVLSGMMQPSGVINFGDTGMREPLKDLATKQKEKEAKIAEDLASIKTMQAKYSAIEETCNIDTSLAGSSRSSDGSSRVTGSSLSCSQAVTWLQSCSTKSSTPTGASAADVEKWTTEKTAKETENAKIVKNNPKTYSDNGTYIYNLGKIDELQAKIDGAATTSTTSSSGTTGDNLNDILTVLSASVSNSSSSSSASENVADLKDQVGLYFGENSACTTAKEKLQSCSDHLKNVYTEEQRRSNGGDASYGN